MLASQLAIIFAAIFFGVAAYVNIAEQPARRDLDSQSLLNEWKISYKRGFAMQVPLAIAGFSLALIAAWQTADWRWAIGGMILIANLPYTIFEIMPINRQLMSLSGRDSGPAIRTLIERWAHLHAGRTLLAGAATGVLLWASLL
jgi:Domain of unknown function (DUF1772)